MERLLFALILTVGSMGLASDQICDFRFSKKHQSFEVLEGDGVVRRTYDYDSALEFRNRLIRSGVCKAKTTLESCEITRHGRDYYRVLRGDNIEQTLESREFAQFLYNRMISDGLCTQGSVPLYSVPCQRQGNTILIGDPAKWYVGKKRYYGDDGEFHAQRALEHFLDIKICSEVHGQAQSHQSISNGVSQ
ncbi:MAG: hypothetical protein AB7F59_02010 [Bdellovibrionales bacterium]